MLFRCMIRAKDDKKVNYLAWNRSASKERSSKWKESRRISRLESPSSSRAFRDVVLALLDALGVNDPHDELEGNFFQGVACRESILRELESKSRPRPKPKPSPAFASKAESKPMNGGSSDASSVDRM